MIELNIKLITHRKKSATSCSMIVEMQLPLIGSIDNCARINYHLFLNL